MGLNAGILLVTKAMSGAYAEAMPLDWTVGALAEGLRCYRNSEFFLAHEHWESVWLKLEEPEKSFLQALIQTAAAFHHLKSGNPVGAASLLRRSLRRLELCPASFGGIATGPLCHQICEWLAALEHGTHPLPADVPAIVSTNYKT
jgi:predicted metal-dependent hydrolase